MVCFQNLLSRLEVLMIHNSVDTQKTGPKDHKTIRYIWILSIQALSEHITLIRHYYFYIYSKHGIRRSIHSFEWHLKKNYMYMNITNILYWFTIISRKKYFEIYFPVLPSASVDEHLGSALKIITTITLNCSKIDLPTYIQGRRL